MSSKNTRKCDICNVFLSSNDADHTKGKRHLRMLSKNKDLTCGVFITRLPDGKTKEEILEYFSSYGSIAKSYVGPKKNYMILTYENENEATNVLRTTHVIDGKRLLTQKKDPVVKIDLSDDSFTFLSKEMLKRIENVEDLNQQIEVFISCMTPESLKMNPMYNRVVMNLVDSLQYIFPYCRAYTFGSSTTHLQFKCSDLDIFVDVKDKPGDDFFCMNETKRHLRKTEWFRNVIDIPSAKIPIIKCIHNETSVKCDINFKNMLGVKNSELINYYLSLDDNLRPVVLVVKFWAKIHEISGRNHLFTSYAIVMLFIFYLQHKFNYPSVCYLQKHTYPTDSRVIWNMNIQPDSTTKKHQITEPKISILKGFFDYFSNFDYNTYVISTFYGKPLEKDLFSDINNIPTEFNLYKKNILKHSILPLKFQVPICVQDPFELNCNISVVVFQNILDKFVAMCKYSSNILNNTNEKKMLYKLFTEKPKLEIPIPDVDTYETCIRSTNSLDYLKSKITSDLTDTDYESKLNTLWFEEVCDFINVVLTKIYKADVSVIDVSKTIKLNDDKDVHDGDSIKKMKVTCYINLWGSRSDTNLLAPLIKDSKTWLEEETIISQHLYDININCKPSTPLFECVITLIHKKDPSRVEIKLTRLSSYKKMYKCFALYFRSKLPRWFESYEGDLCKNL